MSNDAVFVKAKVACNRTGMSYKAILKGCKDGTIPHIRIGEGENARFMVNLPLFMEQLNRESVNHE